MVQSFFKLAPIEIALFVLALGFRQSYTSARWSFVGIGGSDNVALSLQPREQEPHRFS
jgi:hypothetical protein